MFDRSILPQCNKNFGKNDITFLNLYLINSIHKNYFKNFTFYFALSSVAVLPYLIFYSFCVPRVAGITI